MPRITESLLENELFGHGKGAFTGAAAARPGLIEHASGGTLFLDEIGTMSKTLQAKLLRALESGEVRRIGENESRRADVRFVAATNVDLKAAIEAGDFRSDLYYRLNVHRIHIPPLRDRGGDLRVLVDHFVTRFGRDAGVERCGDDAFARLSAYDFPGNVRQLEHIIQRAVAIAQGPELRPEDLPEEVAAPPAPPAPEGTVAAATRTRRQGDDLGDAGAARRRDWRCRPRAASQPHDDVAADEEIRPGQLIASAWVRQPRQARFTPETVACFRTATCVRPLFHDPPALSL